MTPEQAEALGVRVRELEWGPRDTLASPLCERAMSQIGVYDVGLTPWRNGQWPMWPPNGQTRWVDSAEAAKVAAQADYEARILAALEATS